MKPSLSILFTVLVFTVFANSQANAQMKVAKEPDFVAKPAFVNHDSGLTLKVWIMSIIKDIGNLGETGKAEDSDNGDVINTHDVLVEISDENGKNLQDEDVKLLMVAPSGKKTSFDLDPKSDQYGGTVAFTESGNYQLTVTLNEDGKPVQRTFDYKIYR